MGTMAPMTSPAPMDFLAGTVCQLTPGTIPWGPGWYLVAANSRVEAGPFLTAASARYASDWLEETGHGVHPALEPTEDEPEPPAYRPRYSGQGLLVGSRVRDRKKSRKGLAPTG